VQLIQNLIERSGRDAEVLTLRPTKTAAYIGEQDEFTLEVCCGSIAHRLILTLPSG
jgi:hypothetical protein